MHQRPLPSVLMRERALGFLQPQHGRIACAGADARVRAHHRVVLLGDPVFRRDRRRGEQAAEILSKVWRPRGANSTRTGFASGDPGGAAAGLAIGRS